MKKRVSVLVMSAMVFAVGCSKNAATQAVNEQTSSPSSVETTANEESEASSVEVSDNEELDTPSSAETNVGDDVVYADMIPNPESVFAKGTITVTDPDGGKAYMLEVTGYEDGEYETYVSGCKEAGFTEITYDTSHDRGKDFGAYTSDGKYWVQVNLDAENNVLYIICQKSKKALEEKGE